MKLIILGSGTAVPFQQRASSSLLLKLDNTNILLDAGFWVVERLEQLNFPLEKLDYIFLSHKHPDHFMGLIHILFALKNPCFKREEPLKLFGFEGMKNYFNQFESILGSWIKPNFDILFFEHKEYIFEDFSYSLFKTNHSEESVGIKILKNNKKIVYTSDTEFFPELSEHIKNADILISECGSSVENPVNGHLNYREIIDFTKNLNIKKIILTHFYPDSLPPEKLPENFIIGKDLIQIKII